MASGVIFVPCLSLIINRRAGIRRAAFASAVAAAIIIAGVAVSYPRGPTTSTTASSHSSTTGLENPGCGVGPSYGDEWLTYKHDSQRTGYSSYGFSTSAAGKFLGQLAWQNKSGFSEMAATESELFVSSWWLFALNLTNGKGLWTETTGAGPAPPISANGNTVYLGENIGPLTAFNATTGASSQVGSTMYLATSAICGDVAYANSGSEAPGGMPQPGASTDSLQALNLTSGQNIWTVSLTSGFFNSFYPTTDGHAVYMLMDNGTVFAYSAASGALEWRKTIPLVNVTTVTTSTGPNGARTIIVNATGADDFVLAPPVSDGKLYVTTTFGVMYALDATTGSVVWSTNLGTRVADPRGGAAVGYGKVFEGTSEGLLAVNATDGSVVWKAPLNSTDTSAPAVVDGYVFIADSSGTLYQFNETTGALLWSFTGLGAGFVSEPIVAGGLVAVDGNNGVFAFR